MEEQKVIQQLDALFNDPNGFLVQLHVHMKFDEQLYQKVFVLFSEYIKLLDTEVKVNRRTARFLYDVVTTLEGEAYQLSLRNHPDAVKVSQAHAEMIELLFKLLP